MLRASSKTVTQKPQASVVLRGPPTRPRLKKMIPTAKQSLMEVTGALSHCARNAGFSFGADTVLVAVQHMLYQTVDLFRTPGEAWSQTGKHFRFGKGLFQQCFGDLNPAKDGRDRCADFDWRNRDISTKRLNKTSNISGPPLPKILLNGTSNGSSFWTMAEDASQTFLPLYFHVIPLRVSNRLRWACSCSKKTRLRLPCSHGPGPQSNFKSAGTFFRIA